MVQDTQDKGVLIACIALGATLAEILVVLTVGNEIRWPANAILFFLFFVYLVGLAGYASGVISNARTWYADRRDRRFLSRRLSAVVQERVKKVTEALHATTSGGGSIQNVAQKFFERPSTLVASTTSSHPTLQDVIPDFYQVIDILVGDERTLSISFGHLADLNKNIMSAVSICLTDLGNLVNRHISWTEVVLAQCAKHKNTCPSVAYSNAAAQYAQLQQNYLQLVAEIDSLVMSINDAARKAPSVHSELSLTLSKRALSPFP
jgi:hypothetical protein